jgi:hypothetical protein
MEFSRVPAYSVSCCAGLIVVGVSATYAVFHMTLRPDTPAQKCYEVLML